MKKRVKVILFAAAALLAAGAFWFYARLPITAETRVVRPATETVTFTEQGVYGYDSLYTVYPIVAGEVLEVRVQEGDRLSAGDVIAVINARDFENQITQMNSTIAGYEGQISNLWLQEQQQKDTLAANLESLKGQQATLRAEIAKNRESTASIEAQIAIQEDIVAYNRDHARRAREDLRDAGDYYGYGDGYGDYDAVVSQARQAYNAAQNTLAGSELLLEQLRSGEMPDDVYEGQLEAVQAQIDTVAAQMDKSYSWGMRQYYDAQIEAAKLAISQMEEQAGKAEITAGIGGIVSSLPIRERNVISGQEPVAVLGGSPLLEVFVPVREIDGVAAGDKVELLLDKRLGEEATIGTVTQIEEEAQVKLSALGVEERKIRVLIRPEGSALQIGYTVDVRFTVFTQENALSVPKTAVFSADGKDFVWLVQEGVLVRQEVTRGMETREGYIIGSGLSDGSVVVTDANNPALAEGKRIAE